MIYIKTYNDPKNSLLKYCMKFQREYGNVKQPPSGFTCLFHQYAIIYNIFVIKILLKPKQSFYLIVNVF